MIDWVAIFLFGALMPLTIVSVFLIIDILVEKKWKAWFSKSKEKKVNSGAKIG